MGIGVILKQARLAQRLSLGELSARAGLHKSTLSRWESGKSVPYALELTRVMDALSLSASQRQACWQGLDAPRAMTVAQNSAGAGTAPVSSGELLRALRVRSGVSQGDAARASGVTQSMVSRWESGECWPEGDKLHALCFSLGATAEELIFLTTRGWQQHEPLSNDKEALDRVLDYLEYYDTSENRGLVYLALAGRYQTLYLRGKLNEIEATDVWGRYAYYLCWRLQRYTDALRIVAPAKAALKRTRGHLSRGQVEAVSALFQHHTQNKQEDQARELMVGIEGLLSPARRSWWLDFMGQALERAGQPLQAIAYQRDAVLTAATPHGQRLRQIRLASLLSRQGNFREALATVAPLEQSLRQESKVHAVTPLDLTLQIAWALAGLGERAEAQSYVERAMPYLVNHSHPPIPLPAIYRLLNV
jgi:transcriptional regulator with XRE-family HTH domain